MERNSHEQSLLCGVRAAHTHARDARRYASTPTRVQVCIPDEKEKERKKRKSGKEGERERGKKGTCICANNRTPSRKEEPASYTRN